MVSVKDQYSHLVYPIMYIRIINLLKFWLNWLLKLEENKKKMAVQICVLSDAYLEGFRAEIVYCLSEKLPHSQNILLQRELFLKMF